MLIPFSNLVIIYLLAYEDGIDSVPKRRHIKFISRGITQKKTYNKTGVIPHLPHQSLPTYDCACIIDSTLDSTRYFDWHTRCGGFVLMQPSARIITLFLDKSNEG
jgi:hypothetical protein